MHALSPRSSRPRSRPIATLARELLTRRDYDVAFVGNFSCGKSTLINAVLAEPRFLPTDQTECTLAIARVGPPHPERGEGIEVEFFTEQEALQNVLANNRYKDDLGEPAKKLLRSEEHTSELQSQSNLVCRLLLEKK